MRGAELMRGSVRTQECDGYIELAARHREHVGGVVHHLIEGYERKAERHKFNDRPQSDHRRADSEAGESVFADWSVNDPPWPKALKQALADLVCALIFGDLFAHQKNIRVPLEFFPKRFIERLAISDFSHVSSELEMAHPRAAPALTLQAEGGPAPSLRRHTCNRKAFRAAAANSPRQTSLRPEPFPSPACRARQIVRLSISPRA